MTFVACKKEYKKSENGNVEIVSDLNEGNYQAVIDKSSRKEILTPREKYYLASAHAMSGGIDVYSLYSVMEIQLFHKKALDWSSLSQEKNPYLKFMKNQEGIDFEERQKKREERWEKLLPKIKQKNGFNEKTGFEDLRADEYCNCPDLAKEQYDDAVTKLDKIYLDFIKKDVSLDEVDDLWYKLIFEQYQDELSNIAFSHLQNAYFDKVFLHLKKQNYLNPKDKSQDAFGDVQWEMLYMNILWNTYEAIPLMKKLPNLSQLQQAQVTLSMNQYLGLINEPEFKEVSLRNLMILTGVSLLSLYKASFDLEEVDSIQDLYCSFDPMAILDNYGLIRKRILFIQEAYEKAGLDSKDYLKYKKQIESFKELIPLELTTEQRERYIDSVDNFKVDSCFNG
jgi:hypothetical protein